MLLTSPSAPAAAQKTYAKALGWNRSTRVDSPSRGAAEEAAAQRQSAPKNQVTTIPAESFGQARALTAHEYKVNAPELQRLRENNPKAADTIMTEVSAAPMTWEAYDALSADQRAAVDFNTLLVEAREKDLAPKKPMTAQEWIEYGNDVRSMFGEAGGSRTVAPNTVKLLKSIDFKAVGQDLDEFLSMERGISVDELGSFSFSNDDLLQLSSFDREPLGAEAVKKMPGVKETGVPLGSAHPALGGGGPINMVVPSPQETAQNKASEEYAGVRSAANLAAIDTTLIQSALNTYKQRLQQGTGAPWSITANFGDMSALKPADMPLGYVVSDNPMDYRAQLSVAFDDVYNLLRGNPNKDGLDAMFADFAARNWTDEDKAQLWTYLDERTRREMNYLDDQDAQSIRALLGWK